MTVKGPMMKGAVIELGPTVCLRKNGVRIVVGSRKAQMLDREMYRIAGIEPESMRILVNKSSVHFRADFTPIAETILVAQSLGRCPQTLLPCTGKIWAMESVSSLREKCLRIRIKTR